VQALGGRWQKVGSLADARAAAGEARAEGGRLALVFLDLGWRSGDALALARELRADPDLASIPLVAFGSHVQADRLESARAAGCDLALPNSALTAGLPDLLRRYLGNR
jgi:CheY-like chemotaxis protein